MCLISKAELSKEKDLSLPHSPVAGWCAPPSERKASLRHGWLWAGFGSSPSDAILNPFSDFQSQKGLEIWEERRAVTRRPDGNRRTGINASVGLRSGGRDPRHLVAVSSSVPSCAEPGSCLTLSDGCQDSCQVPPAQQASANCPQNVIAATTGPLVFGASDTLGAP